MKLFLPMLLLLFLLPMPASALDITAPTVPSHAADQMPKETGSFGEGLSELIQQAFFSLRPDLKSAVNVCLSLIAVVMAIAIVQNLLTTTKVTAELAGTVAAAGILVMNTNSMIHLGAATITDLTEYGKLLYPVMTAALAAQGGVTASAGLYAGTMAFIAILTSLMSNVFLPLVYVFLALSIAYGALSESFLARMKAMVKQGIGWCLKILLTIFTSYLSITGVVSGTTDALALKAAKVTISAAVPVVGSILSDASESILVSASVAKNAAGIYGILAILAVFLEPFLRIGLHYGMLKVTAAVCELLGPKGITKLIDDFSDAMGLLLAMTGSVCLLLLISTICFMKGAI